MVTRGPPEVQLTAVVRADPLTSKLVMRVRFPSPAPQDPRLEAVFRTWGFVDYRPEFGRRAWTAEIIRGKASTDDSVIVSKVVRGPASA